jgi:DNA-binding SARP family transcriptional activator
MEFRLLGPVEVQHGGQQVPIGGTKPRILLTALLLSRGHVVPAERLVELIWGEAPPPTARAVVQTYVASLRRAFKAAGMRDVIASHPVGYRADVPASSLDCMQFQWHVEQGRANMREGRHQEACDSFRAALALWRGSALGGIGDCLLRAEADRLDELRLTVTEERIAAELTLGRSEELLGELRELVSVHPEHERLRRGLMLALYRSGRQSEALATFRECRERLAATLGIEPGPELQQIHQAILLADPALLPVPEPQPQPVVPQQLPSPPSDFTGRTEAVAVLRANLTEASGTPVTVISGAGGIGKSALATYVASQVAGSFPDGQLYLELRGTTETPATPEEVLGRILRGLGTPTGSLPPSVEERASHYRTLLAGRRVLIVLDDAAMETQVRPLLPGSPCCAVLITSRNRLGGLAGATFTELGTLSDAESRELLRRVAGAKRTIGDEAARGVVSHCGHLPLAIRIAGARLATRPQLQIDALLTRFADEKRRLDELAVGDQEVRASIGLSYELLTTPARTALRQLAILGLPSFPIWVAAAATETSDTVAERILDQLVNTSLVEVDGIDAAGQVRYRLHDLIRLFALERAEAEDTTAQRAATITAVLSGWLGIIDRIVQAAPSAGITTRTSHHATPVDPATVRTAVADPHAWFRAEEEALVAGVEVASAMDLDEVAVELASALCQSAFITNNLFQAWHRTHTAALAVTRRTGNALGQATLLAELGQLYCEQDQYPQAREHLGQALTMFRAAKDARGEAAALAALGAACREQGYLPEALHFLDRSEQLWITLDDLPALAHVTRLKASVHLEIGDYATTWAELTRALSTYRAANSRRGEGLTLRTMSLYHRARGELDRAENTAEQALAIFQDLGDQLMTAYAARALAKTHIRAGRHAEAHAPLENALITARVLKDRWGEACTLRTLGELHLAEGRLYRAQECLAEALRQWDTLNIPLFRARTLRDLAELHHHLGDEASGHAARAEAIEIFYRYGSREHGELTQ